MALKAHKRIMISMYVKPRSHLEVLVQFKNKVVFPLLWLDESGEMSEEDEKDYKKAITHPLNVVDGVLIGIFMVGGALLFLAGTVLCYFS